METRISNIPVVQKSKIENEPVASQGSSCCIPKNNASTCCTPSVSKEENQGACCAQPEDGSVCCNK